MPGHVRAPRRHGRRAAARRSRVRSTIRRRGLYSVGPVAGDDGRSVRHSFATRVAFGRAQNVLVYPRAVELPRLLRAARQPARRGPLPAPHALRDAERRRASGRTSSATASTASTGRSTARTGELMVKLFELDPASDIWVILDLAARRARRRRATTRPRSTASASPHRSRATSSSRTARSASCPTAAGFDVDRAGARACSSTRASWSRWRWRAPGATSRWRDLLSNEARRFGRHTTVVVDHAVDRRRVGGVAGDAAGARRQGGRDRPGAEHVRRRSDSSLGVFASLAATDVFSYMVKHADDLATRARRDGMRSDGRAIGGALE